MIGIKLADGSFYLIFDESVQQSGQLALIPANNDQQTVIVPFYYSKDSEFSQSQLIGKVELNNLLHNSEESSDRGIALDIELVHNEMLNVHVRDGRGEESEFFFNIKETEVENLFDTGDFQVENIDVPDSDGFFEPSEEFIGEESLDEPLLDDPTMDAPGVDTLGDPTMDAPSLDEAPEELWDDTEYDWSHAETIEERKPLNAGIIAVFSILIATIIVGISFLFFRLTQGETVPFMEATIHTARTVAVLLPK